MPKRQEVCLITNINYDPHPLKKAKKKKKSFPHLPGKRIEKQLKIFLSHSVGIFTLAN